MVVMEPSPHEPPVGEAEQIPRADADSSGDFVSAEEAAAQMQRKKRAGGVRGGVVGAAMLAVGEIIEPHKAEVSIEQQADVDTDDPLAGLDFGSLPPLS